MGLLPNEKLVDFAWVRATGGIRHLRPTSTHPKVLLNLSTFYGRGKKTPICIPRTGDEVPIVPQPPMSHVPKYHFHVELSVLSESIAEFQALLCVRKAQLTHPLLTKPD